MAAQNERANSAAAVTTVAAAAATETAATATETAAAATETSAVQTRAVLRVILIALAVAAALWMLYALEGVILLVVLAIFFAYLISPVVEFLRRPFHLRGQERVMPRALAVGIVYLVLFGAIGTTLYVLLPRLGEQITDFVKQAPTYLATARGRAQTLQSLYQRYQLPPAARETVTKAVTSAVDSAGTYLSDALKSAVGLVTYIPWLVLIPILAFFFLKDADNFRRAALRMLPVGRWRWRGDELFQDINSTLAAYIRAQLTACLLIGIICTAGFWLIGVNYWLALGIIAGLFEFIPLAGPLLLAVIAIAIASFHSSSAAVTTAVFLIVLRGVEDYVIYPRLIGQGIHLHPLAVILAILCGAELAGITGIFLAIPVVAIISVSYRHILEHKGSEGLVAELLKPAETVATETPATVDATIPASTPATAAAPPPPPDSNTLSPATTPEQMARARPDLLTGNLKLPGS
ncbi:MAG: AI-2E family transporter [Pyrinomonadaceae bacterium]